MGKGGAATILALLLAVALVAGGGGTPAPMPELFVEICGLAALAWAAISRQPGFSLVAALRRDPVVFGLGLLLVLVMLVQLVPLPPSIWQGLPGRSAIVENAKAFPEPRWLPFSISPQATLAAALSLIAPLAAYLISGGTRPRQRDWFIPALAIFGVVTILLEIVQLGGGLALYPTNGEGFSRGFQANRNAQGDIIAILFAALACRPFAGGHRLPFTLAQAVIAVVLLLAVVLTGSRAGIALALVGALVVTGRELWARRNRGRRMLAIAGAAIAAAGLAAAALLAGNANVAQALARFSQDENGRANVIWPDAWYTAQQVFPWGTGFGSFVPSFKVFESQELLDSTVANRAHNEILELLVEGGLPAAALAVLAAGFVIWRGWTVWRGGLSPEARARGAMLALASVLLLAHSMLDYPIRSMSIAVCWALLLGLVTADRAQMRGDAEAAEPVAPDGGRSRKSSLHRRTAIAQTVPERLRMVAALAVIVAVLAPVSIVSAFDRSGRALTPGLACVLPTPNACRQLVGSLLADKPEADLSPITEQLARAYPGNAELQALHGTELLRHGNPEGTIFLHNSARLGWREPLGQINAFDAAVNEGDVPRAVIHLDALLRTHPDLVAAPGMLDRFVTRSDVRQEWAARLAQSPDYVRDLLYAVAAGARPEPEATPTQPEAADAAWKAKVELIALARANGLAIPAEWQSTAVRIAYRMDRSRAADLWAAMAGPGGWAKGALAWDISPQAGTLPENGTPFAWSAAGGRQTAIDVERPGGEAARLVMSRQLSGPAAKLATITVFLGPGYHELRWRVTAPQGASRAAAPSDFFPTIACANGGAASFDLIDPPSTDVGVAAVNVPEGCGGAVVAVGKGRGTLPRGTAIGAITIDGKQLLE